MFFTTRAFWTDFAERVVSTGAAGALTVVTLAGFHVLSVGSWHDVAAAAGVAALISALKAFSLQRTATSPAAAPAPAPDALQVVDELGPQPAPTVVAGGGVTSVF